MEAKYTWKAIEDAFEKMETFFMSKGLLLQSNDIAEELKGQLQTPMQKILAIKNGSNLMPWGKYQGCSFAFIFFENNQYLDYVASLKDPKPVQADTIRAMNEFIEALKAEGEDVYQKKKRNLSDLKEVDPKKLKALEAFSGGSTILTFGKWEDFNLAQVYLQSPGYINYLVENVSEKSQPGLRIKLEVFVHELNEHGWHIPSKKRKLENGENEDDMSGINIP